MSTELIFRSLIDASEGRVPHQLSELVHDFLLPLLIFLVIVQHVDDDLLHHLLPLPLHDDDQRGVEPLLEDPSVAILLKEHACEGRLEEFAPDAALLLEVRLDRLVQLLSLLRHRGAQIVMHEFVEGV